MEYELVKYRYGITHRYTAFCLTPRLANPRVVERGGQTFTVTSQGASSNAARHFQKSETAKRYLGRLGVDPAIFDFSLLPDTEPFSVADEIEVSEGVRYA